jgi:hypothetical protein
MVTYFIVAFYFSAMYSFLRKTLSPYQGARAILTIPCRSTVVLRRLFLHLSVISVLRIHVTLRVWIQVCSVSDSVFFIQNLCKDPGTVKNKHCFVLHHVFRTPLETLQSFRVNTSFSKLGRFLSEPFFEMLILIRTTRQFYHTFSRNF